jgi:hypothetical protein
MTFCEVAWPSKNTARSQIKEEEYPVTRIMGDLFKASLVLGTRFSLVKENLPRNQSQRRVYLGTRAKGGFT